MQETAVTLVQIPEFPSLTIGIVVFFLGAFLTRRAGFLREYNIPEAVSGGIAVALLTWASLELLATQIVFDLSNRDRFLVIFFATVGLNARFGDLAKGGRLLPVLLGLAVALVVVQNVIGAIAATSFGMPAQAGVLLGSASLIGGHGTAIAWGRTLEEASGMAGLAEMGITVATLGLIAASLAGGPIARHLVERRGLSPDPAANGPTVGLPPPAEGEASEDINYISLMRALLATHVAVLLGYAANQAFAAMGLTLPLFVACMLAAILLTNTVPHILPGLPWPARSRSLALIADFCLSIFLAMSLMSMQLQVLVELGPALMVTTALQVLAAVAFTVLLAFRLLGSDYRAAVLSAGFVGFGLGATPTAIANMSAVTKHYGPAPLAFIVLPLVSAFFIDLINAMVIKLFVAL